MDRSRVEAVVAKHLPGLQAELGLDRWTIQISYEATGADGDGYLRLGECTRLVDYESACFTLNPEGFSDEAAVLKTLRHELFHVVLAPFDLYLAAVERLGLTSPTAEVVGRVWDHAAERGVAALERMWRGLTT